MKAVVYTLGCKVNAVESRSIIRQLSDNGWDVTDTLAAADIYILNTCTVTAEADRKCRQVIGKMSKFNPRAKIYIIGCSSQSDPEIFLKYSNVAYVGGNSSKLNVITAIMSDIIHENIVNIPMHTDKFEELPFPLHTKTREFIKVQDGCNNYCSYCRVPYVRGCERSRSIESIIEEAQEAAKICKEIVITGINVSAYGNDTGLGLSGLFLALKHIPVRKRLSSLECCVVDEKLLDAIADAGFCDHFHLSLQSGSDEVLRAMNRHYSTGQYYEKIEMIRKSFPNAGITTDIIAGFPTESDDDFKITQDFIQKCEFSDMHIFPYSERAGTPAALLPQVPMDIRRDRASRLSVIKREMKYSFIKNQVGKTLSVYTETGGEGYATNYVRVYTGQKEGDISDIKIQSAERERAVGSLADI